MTINPTSLPVPPSPIATPSEEESYITIKLLGSNNQTDEQLISNIAPGEEDYELRTINSSDSENDYDSDEESIDDEDLDTGNNNGNNTHYFDQHDVDFSFFRIQAQALAQAKMRAHTHLAREVDSTLKYQQMIQAHADKQQEHQEII